MLPSAKTRHHILYLDGLRGIAILMVVMVHVSIITPGLPPFLQNLTFYGVRGVQLFFIVSGLTLTMSHLSRPLHLLNFAARRFFRIAPMFYLGAALYVSLGIFTDLKFAPKDVTFSEIAATLSFVHDWSLYANNKVVPGGWSIGCEAMFYLIFPLLLRAIGAARVNFWPTLAIIYVLAAATNIGIRHLLVEDRVIVQQFSFSFWLCQLPAFATGCWIATTPLHDRITVSLSRCVMAVALILIMVDSQLRGRTNLLVAIFLLSIFVWSASHCRPKFLEAAAVTFLGRVSFSLYIVHFLVVGLLAYVSPTMSLMVGPTSTFIVLYFATLAIAVPISAFAYQYIERPFIEIGRSAFSQNRLKLEEGPH